MNQQAGCKDEDFLLVDENNKKLYFLRSESTKKRLQWVQAINLFCKNLNDEMKIINFPKTQLNKKIMNCLLQNACSLKEEIKP